MRSHLPRLALILALLASFAALCAPAQAQGGVFPLPAPLYILTADHVVLLVEPDGGAQTQISLPNQPVADFDIAPDGLWWVYRTSDSGMIIVNPPWTLHSELKLLLPALRQTLAGRAEGGLTLEWLLGETSR